VEKSEPKQEQFQSKGPKVKTRNSTKKKKSNEKEEYTESSLELCFLDLPTDILSNPNVFIENLQNHWAQTQLKNRIRKIFAKKGVVWSKINKGLLL